MLIITCIAVVTIRGAVTVFYRNLSPYTCSNSVWVKNLPPHRHTFGYFIGVTRSWWIKSISLDNMMSHRSPYYLRIHISDIAAFRKNGTSNPIIFFILRVAAALIQGFIIIYPNTAIIIIPKISWYKIREHKSTSWIIICHPAIMWN